MRARQMAGTRRAAAALALAGLAATVATAVPQAGAAVPQVRVNTGGVSHVKGTSGQLNGVLLADGVSAAVFFEYGPNGFPPPAGTKAYGAATKPLTIAPTNKAVKVGQLVNGLLPGYHYRMCATYTPPGTSTPAAPVCGKDKSFAGGKLNALKFQLPKGKEERLTAIYGGSFELAGSLTGKTNASHGLSLQATPFPYTEPFTTLGGSILTSRTGSFVFKIARITGDTQLRIATIDTRPTYSQVLTVHVSPRITLHVRSAGHSGLYRMYGTVSPARNGASVTVQQLVPRKASSKREGPATHGVGSTLLKRATKSLSRFSVIVHLSGNFRYRAFVKLPKGALESGHSANVLVKAPKASGLKRARR